MTISKGGRPIQGLQDWGERAGPKSVDHWVANRSAMELARSWLAVTSPAMPPEIEAVMRSHSAFGVVESWNGEPEARLPFDGFRGEPRNADLAIYARDQYGEFIIAVEGKADETFGETVADALAAAVDRKFAKPQSNGVLRIERLAAALLGPRRKTERRRGAPEPPEAPDPRLGALRYQLLTATAGALRAGELRGVGRVVLLIHEFRTRLTVPTKHEANGRDLDTFVARLSHRSVTEVIAGVLYGPFKVPGAPILTDPPLLFIGKAICNLCNRAK